MRRPGWFLVLGLGCFVASTCYAQGNAASNQKPCRLLTKSEAETILGHSVVLRNDSAYDCSFVQDGFIGGTGPNSKQVSLSIWRSAMPKPDDVSTRRASIASDHTSHLAVRDIADFADAAIWSWTPGWGRLNAFKGGTVEVEVVIGGLQAEGTVLQNAKNLASRALGGSAKTNYDYARAAAASAAQAHEAAQPQPLASFQPTWMGQNKVVRGTVSRVNVEFSRVPQWVTIFFRESPDAAFVACSPYPDMLQDSLGDLSALVGKTLEISGQIEPAMCRSGKGASIRLLVSKQYRAEGGPPPGRIVAAGGGAPIAHRQGARVGLDICNAGETEFDAFVVRQGRATTTHLAPRDCAHVYEETGGGAYVGFGFADGRGQWGGPRRIDLLPNTFGSYNAPTRVWSGAGQSFPVNRGGRSVSMPMQMLFSPPAATCTTSEPYSAVAHLPLNATSAQRNAAYMQDANMPVPQTTCSSFDYALNAVSYPDSREVSFEQKCAGCPLGQAPATTAAQRAGGQQALAKMSTISPLAGGIMGKEVAREQDQELKRSLEGQKELRRMNWSEMKQALAKVSPTGGRPPEMPESLIVRATVSRVEVSPPQASEHWVNVYFRESPEEQAFNICTSDPEILVDRFGPDFRMRMIGQMLEVEGEYQRNYCKGTKGSMRITLAHQLRKVTGQ
jgi:hypothetical protein